MDVVTDLLQKALTAIGQLALQPFYYIGILFVVLQYRRQVLLERQLFSTRLHSMRDMVWRTLLWGLAAGALVSVTMAFIGAAITFGTLVWLWALTLLLGLCRIRFVCLAYAVGLFGILQSVAQLIPATIQPEWIGQALEPLRNTPLSSLLALVGILHLAEALLTGRLGSAMAMPAFVPGKRGKAVGGYQLQQFWPVPLLLLVPASGGASVPWTPLFGGEAWAGGSMFAALPVLLGFSERTTTQLPAEKTGKSARRLTLYALLLLGLAAAVEWAPVLALVGALASIALHEALFWWSRWDEKKLPPLYIHDERGLKILAVLPGSPAKEMGLLPGEMIHKANGVKVQTKEQLHEALRMNGAFCKLEVINTDGHSKFVQRALFEGEHHLLGVLLAPDERVKYVLEQRNVNWFTSAKRTKSSLPAGESSGTAM